MPVVSTHHKILMEPRSLGKYDINSEDINSLITSITFNILKECPGLVADVANGESDRSALEIAIIKNMDKHKYHFGLFREELIKKVFDFMFGYGQLQPYIEDEDITDIDGTAYNEFVIKKNGERHKIDINFGSERTFDAYCKLIAIRNGGILNENDSHCRITDEKKRLRINVSIKPRNITSPAISIRKHRLNSYTLDDLKDLAMYNNEINQFLKFLASVDSTVIFCGKGAAGKTSLLRAFVNALPEMDRVLIIESDAEIFPDKPYCIEQRIKKKNEGGRPVTLRELAQDGLTMSLDSYCIGEIVGDEAWEFIKAAFTGHRGMATTHGESGEDVLSRLLTLSKGANIGESEKTIKEMMAKSIDIIVYLKEFKIVDILEVLEYEAEGDKFIYNRLFKYETLDELDKTDNQWVKCGDMKGDFGG